MRCLRVSGSRMRHPRLTRSYVLTFFVSCFLTISCGPTVDLGRSLRIEDVATGWADAGRVEGKNKLVPAVSLKLTNASQQTLSTLQLNAVFRRVDETAEWGTGFLTAAGA